MENVLTSMAAKIKSDVLQALADWNAGKPVRSLELGHSHRMKETTEPTAQPQVDFEHFLHRDQERAHAYCFMLIECFVEQGVPEEHLEFLERCKVVRIAFEIVNKDDPRMLIQEEAVGAESLAWKALRVGWARAIAGHEPHDYIEVTNPAVQASAT
jgi:hypothetical protein